MALNRPVQLFLSLVVGRNTTGPWLNENRVVSGISLGHILPMAIIRLEDCPTGNTATATPIHDPRRLSKHRAEIEFFLALIIDMKKQVLGHGHKPITMERLDEASHHISKLYDCKQVGCCGS